MAQKKITVRVQKKWKLRKWFKFTLATTGCAVAIIGASKAYQAIDSFASTGEDVKPENNDSVVHVVVETADSKNSKVTTNEDGKLKSIELKATQEELKGKVFTIVFNDKGNVDKAYSTDKKSLDELKKKNPEAYKQVLKELKK
jgi:hypothetical protein